MMKTLRACFFLLLTATLFVILNSKIGDIPPMAKFLDPFRGFWQNAEPKEFADETRSINGLNGRVDIMLDNHFIPHVFARNEYDLYFAQGYITASDRLWQMDFQTRFAAGRLSEVVGVKAVELDRYQRRMGMTFGAENMLRALEKHPKIKAMLQAYADGVNAYIRSLSPADYPIEFKILDYRPEKWTPLNTGLLLKLMSATLAGSSDEFYMSNALQKFGPEVMNDLFPDHPYKKEPIIPEGTRWAFTPLKVPEQDAGRPGSNRVKTYVKDEGTGSNNWAVSGSRTSSGFPLLANDPHLDLSLPSIWYQIQLAGPGMNVNGVSLPGAPGVIIGYNQQVAWGVTNVGSDVLDWYQVKFRDKKQDEYWYNNQWRKVHKRYEKIKIRGRAALTDTVCYTHQGPVVYSTKPANFLKAANVPDGYALRWIAHDPSVDIATFYYLNRAKNYADYRKALSYFSAPAQNFAFASTANDIAITANGWFPLKWPDHGKYLLDGSRKENDWPGRIPAEQNPSIKNPSRGFVSSANQPSTDKSYPYFLNWEFAGYERAHRINSRLSKMRNATVDSMRSIQNDNFSVNADNVLPVLLKEIDKNKLNATQHEAFDLLLKWNKYYNADEIAASIFEVWHKDLYSRIWDEFRDPKLPMRMPNRDRTVHLLVNEPDSPWFDIASTPGKETRRQLINTSFKFAIDSLYRQYGTLGKSWEWGRVKHSHIPHLAKIAGFGTPTLITGGSKGSVNSLGESNGPSWRMVVQLGREPRGYGILPGGQSGNPGSFFYDDMIGSWMQGKLEELVFLKSASQKNKRIIRKITLTNKK